MKARFYSLILILLPFFGYAQDRQADSLILVQLYNTLDGPNWNNPENWLSSEPLEVWKGIFIENERVVKVELIGQGTSGNFPTEILGLDQLHTFEVRQGSVTGEIPAELVQLTKLRRFMMNATGISGDILNIWDQFQDLQSLGLSQNNLTGSLPDINDKLTLLYIQGNQLSGEIPASWVNKNVTALQIQENNLIGAYDNFATWSNLRSIDIGDNNWTESTFPNWVDDLIFLNRFSCDNCNLSGELPDDLDFLKLHFYDGMFLSGNDLSGDISLLFNSDTANTKLYLRARDNNFSGEFPAHKLSGVSRIDVRNNQYSSITAFDPDISFQSFDISYNNFNYDALETIQSYIEVDTVINIIYNFQKELLTPDTMSISNPKTITILSGDSHSNTDYEWRKNGVIIEGENESELEIVISDPSDGGHYYCEMSNPDFPELVLQRNTIVINVNFSVSTNNTFQDAISFYPNPTLDYLNINVENSDKEFIYKLFDTSGRLILLSKKVGNQSINLNNLSSGVYSMLIEHEGKFITQKIIKL